MITVNFNKVFVENNVALGNHMFQYAIARLVAHKNGFNFHIPDGKYISKCFPKIDLGLSDGNTIYQLIEDTMVQSYNPEIFTVPDFTFLSGYFQTEKYYDGYEDIVKSWFEVEMDTTTEKILNKYDVDNYCYIHIRGGDNKFGNNNWLIPKEYYIDAMIKIKELKNDISFVIVTDDPDLSKQYFPEIDVIEYDNSSDDITKLISDFKSLYYSKYSIISASTLSWWAAWLSDKIITVAPNNWLNYNKPGSGFYPSDIKSKKFIYV